MIPSLVLAVRFLTIVPVPGREAEGQGALGRAACWFPLVGLLLGAALGALSRVLEFVAPPLLSAGMVVAAWTIATGGIHLDGLADCLDGLGGADRAARLAIMRDSRIGAFGALGLILCLVLAVGALAEMPVTARWRALLLAPVVGRVAPLVIGPRFAPASPDRGAGALFLSGVPGWAGPIHVTGAIALAGWLFGTWGAAVVLGALLIALGWSAFVARRLGGITGDVLGSGVTLAELSALAGAACLAFKGMAAA